MIHFRLAFRNTSAIEGNKLIENQKNILSFGEATLEATPQFCLQLFIILTNMSISWSQAFSISTSIFSLSYPLIEKYHGSNFSSFKDFIFNLHSLILFLNTIGKIMCFSIITVFFHVWSAFIFIFNGVCMFYILKCSELLWKKIYLPSILEAFFLSLITQPNLENNKEGKMYRQLVFYWTFMLYSVFIAIIAVICNINPTLVTIPMFGFKDNVIWSELELVKNITVMNGVCATAVGCLLVSWILDLLCQMKTSNGGVYHAGWRCFKSNYREAESSVGSDMQLEYFIDEDLDS